MHILYEIFDSMYQMIIHQLVNMQIISSSVLQKMIACVKQFIHI